MGVSRGGSGFLKGLKLPYYLSHFPKSVIITVNRSRVILDGTCMRTLNRPSNNLIHGSHVPYLVIPVAGDPDEIARVGVLVMPYSPDSSWLRVVEHL
jgi:hypothetical protein